MYLLFYKLLPCYGENLSPSFFEKYWKLKVPLYKGGGGGGSNYVKSMFAAAFTLFVYISKWNALRSNNKFKKYWVLVVARQIAKYLTHF